MTPKLLDKALKTAGGLHEFNRRINESAEDLAYIEKNKEELLKLYNEKWIAVSNSTIVASGESFREFVKGIKRAGIPFDKVTVEYITRRKELTLF